jgi:hypothetical protein
LRDCFFWRIKEYESYATLLTSLCIGVTLSLQNVTVKALSACLREKASWLSTAPALIDQAATSACALRVSLWLRRRRLSGKSFLRLSHLLQESLQGVARFFRFWMLTSKGSFTNGERLLVA